VNYQKTILKRAEAALVPLLQQLNGEFDSERAYSEAVRTCLRDLPHVDPDDAVGTLDSFREGNKRYGDRLRLYVDTWLEAGCHFGKWMKRNLSLWRRVNESLNHIELILVPGRRGCARVLTLTPSEESEPEDYGVAWALMPLFIGPFHDRIRTCDRCGRYFLNASGYQKKRFCARACAKTFTALESTRKRRDREHKVKVNQARSALRELAKKQPQTDNWKNWVAERAGLTTGWLTRAFNAGKLQVPKWAQSRKAKQPRR
jgi:hypothetical protein